MTGPAERPGLRYSLRPPERVAVTKRASAFGLECLPSRGFHLSSLESSALPRRRGGLGEKQKTNENGTGLWPPSVHSDVAF